MLFQTNAELYLVIREYGLHNNICTYEELGLERPEPSAIVRNIE